MKILLPPSETKRPGGTRTTIDLAALALPQLAAHREAIVDALIALSGDAALAQRVLKLSDRQLADIDSNGLLRSAPTMPAVDRYTGVLYDALDAASLDGAARRWLGAHVLIHSAPFGPVGALDRIPAYRLAAGTALPGVPPLRRHWSDATTAALEDLGFVLDLRSEAYAALGAAPAGSAYVRVVTANGRALNHFNKKAKGELVRVLAQDRPRIAGTPALLLWAAGRGIALRETPDAGEVELVASV